MFNNYKNLSYVVKRLTEVFLSQKIIKITTKCVIRLVLKNRFVKKFYFRIYFVSSKKFFQCNLYIFFVKIYLTHIVSTGLKNKFSNSVVSKYY